MGNVFGFVFFKVWRGSFGDFFLGKKKKNPVLVLITELVSTHVILRQRCPTIIHVNMGLNKEMLFLLKSSRKQNYLMRDLSFPIPIWNCCLPQEHLYFQQ